MAISLIDENGRRRDVAHIANDLAEKSGFSSELVYCFLTNCGKYLSKNPRLYKWDAVPGYVFMVDDPDNFHLGERPVRNFSFDEEAYYWESRILAKQEAWMD